MCMRPVKVRLLAAQGLQSCSFESLLIPSMSDTASSIWGAGRACCRATGRTGRQEPPLIHFLYGDATASRRDPFPTSQLPAGAARAGMPQQSRRRPPAATPLPYRRLVIPLLLFFVEALATSVVLPLTPFVVRAHVQHLSLIHI